MQYTGVEMGGYKAKQPVLIVGDSVLYEEFAGKVGKPVHKSSFSMTLSIPYL